MYVSGHRMRWTEFLNSILFCGWALVLSWASVLFVFLFGDISHRGYLQLSCCSSPFAASMLTNVFISRVDTSTPYSSLSTTACRRNLLSRSRWQTMWYVHLVVSAVFCSLSWHKSYISGPLAYSDSALLSQLWMVPFCQGVRPGSAFVCYSVLLVHAVTYTVILVFTVCQLLSDKVVHSCRLTCSF